MGGMLSTWHGLSGPVPSSVSGANSRSREEGLVAEGWARGTWWQELSSGNVAARESCGVLCFGGRGDVNFNYPWRVAMWSCPPSRAGKGATPFLLPPSLFPSMSPSPIALALSDSASPLSLVSREPSARQLCPFSGALLLVLLGRRPQGCLS